MSDASEVKRFIHWFGPDYDGSAQFSQEVVLASDFDRIMSERDELWKRATKFVMPGEMDTGESIEHYIKTLEQTVAELKAGTANALKRVFNRQIGFLVSANAFRVLCEEIEKYDPFFKMPNSSERRRFVADRNAEMQNLKETVARQAKVIEKLKAAIEDVLHERYSDDDVSAAYSDPLMVLLTAIEKEAET